MAGLYNSNNNSNKNTATNSTNQTASPFAPAPMVDELARQNVAMQQTQAGANATGAVQSGGTNMNVFANGNGVVGKYNVNTAVTQQPTAPYDANTGENTRQPITDFTQFSTIPTVEWSKNGTPLAPGPSEENYDLRDDNDRNYKYDSLSAALNGTNATQSQASTFKKDETKKDGGFFNWIKGLMPKSRPGRHLGETDDEYDARRTKNMQMVATFADAIRQMGNIVNTSKGAPVQTFNDPSALLEAGYQTRKAARQKQAALDADARQKQAEMSLKERANAVDEAYKKWAMGLKEDAAQLGKDKFEYQKEKDKNYQTYRDEKFAYQKDKDADAKDYRERAFKYKQQQDAITNSLKLKSINKRGGSGGGGSSSGGGSYSLYNPETDKTEYFKNEKSWYARAGELGYDVKADATTSTSSEAITAKGAQKTVTTQRGNNTAANLGRQQAAAKAKARQNKQQPQRLAGNKGSGGGKKASKMKNVAALGL